MKKLFITLMVLLLITAIPAKNISANTTTYYSSGNEADSLDAAKAFDGDFSTRWASNKSLEGEKILAVNYPEIKEIQAVRIFWERHLVNQYFIEYKNSEGEWQVAYESLSNQNKFVETIILETAMVAREFRIRIVNHTASGIAAKTSYEDAKAFDSVNWETVSIYELQFLENAPTIIVGLENENLARNASVSLNGNLDQEAGNGVSKMVDGNHDTRWASNRNKTDGEIILDLQDVKKIKALKLLWDPRSNAQGPNVNKFDIYTSIDGSLYVPNFRFEGEPKQQQIINLDEVNEARYLKIKVRSTTNRGWNNVSLQEVELYSHPLELPLDERINDEQITLSEDRSQVILPTFNKDTTVKIVGSNADQVIDLNGKVYEPLHQVEVKLMLEISTNQQKLLKEYTVIVPGKYLNHGVGSKPNVIPFVQQYHNVEGSISIDENTSLINDVDEFSNVVTNYQADLHSRNVMVSINDHQASKKIIFNKVIDKGYGKEGYYLNIESDRIIIEAETSIGASYATMTLLQLKENNIQMGEIKDYPMFEERKFSLDTGRKFFPVHVVKDIIKNMAYYKMNGLQMHLNDNFIWVERLTQRNNPNMEEVLSKMDPGFRIETSFVGENGIALTSDDHYTVAEFRDLVNFAKKHSVEIIPEIDSPGHAGSFVKMRPELMYPDDRPDSPDRLSYKNKPKAERASMLNLADPRSEELVKNVFKELVGTAENPGAFYDVERIHIGTDEYYGNAEQYRAYVNNMLLFVKNELHKTPKFWGSLAGGSHSLAGNTPVTADGVEMDIWSLGWNSVSEALKAGYKISNILDVPTYSVPGMQGIGNENGGYTDFINNRSLYNWNPNVFNSAGAISQAHPQLLGGGYALWNDMNIDIDDVGLTSYDLFDRFFKPLAVAAQKNWNSLNNTSYDDFKVLADEIGYAPNSDPKFSKNIDKEKAIIDLNKENLKDFENQNVKVQANRLTLNKNSNILTNYNYIGLDSVMDVEVKLFNNDQVMKLSETNKDAIYLVDENGYVAYRFEGRHFAYNYKLPLNQRVKLKFVNTNYSTKLFVDGVEVAMLANPKKRNIQVTTSLLPVAKIGAFDGNLYHLKIENTSFNDPSIVAKENLTNVQTNSFHEASGSDSGAAINAFDNDRSTMWHTKWRGFRVSPENPAWISVDFNQAENLSSFEYVPRSSGDNGNILRYQIFIKQNGSYLENPSFEGTFENNNSIKRVMFSPALENVEGVKINVLEGRNNFASASEFIFRKVVLSNENEEFDNSELLNLIKEIENEIKVKKFQAKELDVLKEFLSETKEDLANNEYNKNEYLSAILNVKKLYALLKEVVDEPDNTTDNDTTNNTLNIITNGNVQVEYNRNLFNTDIILRVVTLDEAIEGYKNEDVDLYDIDIIDTTTNEKVNFNGSVKVKIEFDKNKTPIKVYYVGEQLEQLDYKVIRENTKAYVEFEATHFSKYAIVFKSTATSDNTTTIVIDNNKPKPDVVVVNTVNPTVINNTPKLPNTGTNNNYQNLALVMFIIGAYLLKKKY